MSGLELETRNGQFGTRGQQIQVLSNAFRVTKAPTFQVQQYDVAFSEERCKEKKLVVRYLIEKERIFGEAGVGAVYDGQKIIYMPGPPMGSKSFQVSESEARGRPSRPDRPSPKNLTVTITHARSIDMTSLAKLVAGKAGLGDGEILQAVNALNVVIKYAPGMIFPTRKNNFYIPPENQNQRRILGGGLEVYQAFLTSVRPAIGTMIMNFDRGAGAFKMSGNSVEVLKLYLGRRDARDLELARMPPRFQVKTKRFLKNLTVALKFSKDPNAKYKIRGVSDVSAKDFMFEVDKDSGRQTSVLQYIQEKYNYRLEHPYLPCVQLTKIAWYPLECVSFLPGSQFLGKLDPDQVTEMLKFTTMKPTAKLGTLREGMKYLQLDTSPTLKSWQLGVEARPMTVPARVLEPPKLTYMDARSNQEAVVMPRDGGWDTRGKAGLRAAGPIERWFIVVFADEKPGPRSFPRQEVQRCTKQFIDGCEDFGIRFGNKQPFIMHAGANCGDVAGAIKDAAKRAGFSPANPPQLVVTYIGTKSSPEYALIKAFCDVKYFANVALKVNVKFAGACNQRVQGFLPGFQVPTIVFGADVGHPGPGSYLPSIAGVVASSDPHGTRYDTAVRAQNSREEIIADLEGMAFELLRNFQKQTGKAPERVIFYRDGVSEGQFDQVARHEIAALKKAYARVPNYRPQTIFIICGKRHHYKFFPSTPANADRSGNVRAGTVVDAEISHPYYSDFYLVSHGGLLGTSKPTHYTTILNEARFPPDQLQALTYHLTYIYARSTRSVSIATPAYYAHHVCFRARHHIGDDEATTEGGSMSQDQEDRARQQKLDFARSKLAGPNGFSDKLRNTLYFM